jgi:hypothetical protein
MALNRQGPRLPRATLPILFLAAIFLLPGGRHGRLAGTLTGAVLLVFATVSARTLRRLGGVRPVRILDGSERATALVITGVTAVAGVGMLVLSLAPIKIDLKLDTALAMGGVLMIASAIILIAWLRSMRQGR